MGFAPVASAVGAGHIAGTVTNEDDAALFNVAVTAQRWDATTTDWAPVANTATNLSGAYDLGV